MSLLSLSPVSARRRSTASRDGEAAGTTAAGASAGHDPALLSTVLAGRRDRRLPATVILISAILFAAAVPYARTPLTPVQAFIPAYEAALLICDLTTALLFFGQFAQSRSRGLLVLAAGYLFDALMIVPHALSFPGLFSPAGLLGGGQATAWIYMAWHSGFPIFVLGYVLLDDGDRSLDRAGRGAAGGALPIIAVLSVAALAALLTLLAANGRVVLPAIMQGDGYAPAMKFVVSTVWALSLAALVGLWWKRPFSVLDRWLMVVMCAWLFDVALSAVLNHGRFDLGFYAGRLYGLMAASFVLMMLIGEISGLQSRLAAATTQLEDYALRLEDRVRERTLELHRANRELTAIIEASPVAVFMLDREGIVTAWNASAERVFGYTVEEALGRLPPYLAEEHLDDFRANLAHAVGDASATGSHETRRRHKDGRLIDVLARWVRVNDEAGQMLGIMYAAADVTEQKKLEGQLRQAQKMEAIGNLTGGMAHDFNNLLGVIVGNLDLLQSQGSEDPALNELAGEALDAALRGADLTRRLLAFARRQPLQPERVAINELVAGISKLLERTLGEEIQITLELDAGVWPVVADPAQLESSLTNLATNARDAMPTGGQLVIVTGNRHLDEDYASQYAEVEPGDYAVIEITDTGIGMPPEVVSRIFEPFYTTKELGKGTGLGLSMVFGFMKQSGGHINVYSEVGIGTTFRLYLRRAAADAEAIGQAAPQPLVRGRGESVLTVEDNVALRRVVVRQLNELGYKVLEAEDAQSALKLLESERVDLVFTDIVMPGGTSGYELARTTLERWPDIKVLLTSGFPEKKLGGNESPRNIRLLTKPYRRDDLARTIREVLGT